MKKQYVGDINDYRKYALLRALAGDDRIRIGVCWMLTPPDGTAHGRKTAYLDEPHKWRHFDPELFDLLKAVRQVGECDRLDYLEQSMVIPGASYFNDLLPDNTSGRASYLKSAMAALGDADLIFFDPDNGLDVPSTLKGRKDSSKYVYRDEVGSTFRNGHSILIYQHFPRMEKRGPFIRRIGCDLAFATGSTNIWYFRTANVVFFLVIQPYHSDTLQQQANTAARSWDSGFISGTFLPAEVVDAN